MINITKVVCKSDYLQYEKGELIAFYRKKVYEVLKQDGLYFDIKGERDHSHCFVLESFKFHFMDMAEFRDKRIDEIFND